MGAVSRTVSSAQTGQYLRRQPGQEGYVDVEEYTAAVIGYISKFAEEITEEVTTIAIQNP